MKRFLSLLVSLALITSLVACGGNGDANTLKPGESSPSISEPDKPPRIEIKGTFLLEPSEQLDLSGEGLAPVQRYLFLVYDVLSDNTENEELSSWYDSISITMNGENTYDQLSVYEGKILKTFLENCGYAVSTTYGTLWGGSEPSRMIAAFAINGNDVRDDCTAKVEFELSDNLNASVDLARVDIQIIKLFDDVFAVEENPDAYQIARSVKPRAELCRNTLIRGQQEYSNHNTEIAMLGFAFCSSLWITDGPLGFSCDGNTGFNSELPVLDIESVQLYYPDLVDKINVVKENIDFLYQELHTTNPDYESVDSAYRLACNTLEKIIDFFEGEG